MLRLSIAKICINLQVILLLNRGQTVIAPQITIRINPLALLNNSFEISRFTALVDMRFKSLYS